LSSGVREQLKKDPATEIKIKIQKLLTKRKSVFTPTQTYKLTTYHNSSPFIYGFLKIHKPDRPLRHIISFTGSPSYALPGFLHNILSPLVGNTKSLVKKSLYFKELLNNTQVEASDILVSSGIANLFTNVPVDEALEMVVLL
jgi:hypothetical protein